MKLLRFESKSLPLKPKKHGSSIIAQVGVFDTYQYLIFMANLCIRLILFYFIKEKVMIGLGYDHDMALI